MTENLSFFFFLVTNLDFPSLKIKQGREKIADYSYIGRSYRVLSRQFGNGDAVSYLYDNARRLTMKETKNKNSALINQYNYGYNKVHMKTYEQRGHDSNKGDIFAYDGIYRLTGIKFNSPQPANPAAEQFEKHKAVTFDRLSNILNIDETIDGQTQTITTDIPADSTYSKLNQYERFDRWGLSYDLNGNLTQRSTQHNVYDYRNRIVKATDGSSTVNFKYDALGRRIQKEVTLGSQSKTTNFYYSGHQVIEERDGSDQVTRQLIYGNGIDEVIRVDKYTGTTSTPYYFHINEIGSITAVTDANGNIVERVYYDIYGIPTFKDAAGNVIPKSSIGNNILFQGREYDPELNLYYFRARYYDPIMGRFLSTDPMGYADSMNLYQAFNMNPYNFADPFGLAIINLFIGDIMNEANAAKLLWKGKKFPYKYPKWEDLKILAGKNGHNLNIFSLKVCLEGRLCRWRVWYPVEKSIVGKLNANDIINSMDIKKIFEECIEKEDTWTFYVGHSSFHQGRPVGILFEKGVVITNPRMTKNKYIGVFGCLSSNYASGIFPFAQWLFSFKEVGDNDTMSIHKALNSVYALIVYLIKAKDFDPDKAIKIANSGYKKIGSKNEKDEIIVEIPLLNFLFPFY
jgi:RHS repeat-associated protein